MLFTPTMTILLEHRQRLDVDKKDGNIITEDHVILHIAERSFRKICDT